MGGGLLRGPVLHTNEVDSKFLKMTSLQHVDYRKSESSAGISLCVYAMYRVYVYERERDQY